MEPLIPWWVCVYVQCQLMPPPIVTPTIPSYCDWEERTDDCYWPCWWPSLLTIWKSDMPCVRGGTGVWCLVCEPLSLPSLGRNWMAWLWCVAQWEKIFMSGVNTTSWHICGKCVPCTDMRHWEHCGETWQPNVIVKSGNIVHCEYYTYLSGS